MADHRDAEETRAHAPADTSPSDSDAETAAAPVAPTEQVTVADSLAWSQEETTPDEAPYDPETGVAVPAGAAAAPGLKARLWRRLPLIAFGVCAAAALAAVVGAAIALTSRSHNGPSGPTTPANTPPPSTQAPPTAAPSTTVPPRSQFTITQPAQPSPSAPAPPETTPVQAPPSEAPPSATDTPTPTSPAAPPMTTSYVRVPFVPVPIPIQVPPNQP